MLDYTLLAYPTTAAEVSNKTRICNYHAELHRVQPGSSDSLTKKAHQEGMRD